MAFLSTFTTLLLAGVASARVCTNVIIPVDISSRQGLFANVPAEGNLDTGAFALAFTRAGQNLSQNLLQGYQTLTGSYKIAATFCRPDSGPGSTVQLLSHGIGFDKSYWDIPYNNYQYSYVNVAISQGYSTLAIDRFGIGGSSHGDPINTVQAQAEVEALNAVTTKLRNGQLPNISTKFSKVIHVGHSFGSIQSLWLSALYPSNTDGVVLTGYSASGAALATTIAAWNLHSARLNQPLRLGNQRPPSTSLLGSLTSAVTNTVNGGSIVTSFANFLANYGISLSSQEAWGSVATTEVGNILTGYNSTQAPYNYPSGYMVPCDLTATQYVFLLPGFYDIGLGVYSEQNKQPVAIGELLTLTSAPTTSSFSGPVLVFTGQQDEVFCGGDCYNTGGNGPSILDGVRAQFPNANQFGTIIQPNTGHGINVHYNATGGYQAVQNWLGANGLSP